MFNLFAYYTKKVEVKIECPESGITTHKNRVSDNKVSDFLTTANSSFSFHDTQYLS